MSSPETLASPILLEPGNARRRVVLFGASLTFLSFLDRAAISQMAPAISKELHLSSVRMGHVF